MRPFALRESISQPSSGELELGISRRSPMSPHSRSRLPRPALWVAVPVFGVAALGIGAAGVGTPPVAALALAALGAPAVGTFTETRLTRIIVSIGKIAGGDRYTSLPERIGD